MVQKKFCEMINILGYNLIIFAIFYIIMIYLIFRFKKERQLIFDLFRTDESCDNLHFVYKDNFEIFKQQAKLHMKAIKEPL